MGTNYYFVERQNPVKHKYFVNKYHIAKTSAGWRPLFETNHMETIEGVKWVDSINDLQDVYDEGNYYIADEYEEVYTWNSFMKKMNTFQKNGNNKFHYNGCFFDGRGYEFTNEGFR